MVLAHFYVFFLPSTCIYFFNFNNFEIMFWTKSLDSLASHGFLLTTITRPHWVLLRTIARLLRVSIEDNRQPAMGFYWEQSPARR